jgi:abhydrolase domain-containing protein 17
MSFYGTIIHICTMGSLLTIFKTPIESLAFPAPPPSYSELTPNFHYIENEEKKVKVACMIYRVNNLKRLIIYSHGNGCDIGNTDRFLKKLSQDINTNIISYDYVGYGLTKHAVSNKPSEQGCIACIETIHEAMISGTGRETQDIILYGTSIGTGPTVHLAARQSHLAAQLANQSQDPKGVLLQTPYISVVSVVSQQAAYSSHISCDETNTPDLFRSIDLIPKIKCPVIIIHGTDDEVIHPDHARELAKKNQHCKLVIIPGATHNNIEIAHYRYIVENLNKF